MLKEFIQKDIQRHSPRTYALESVLFPFFSWAFFVYAVYFLVPDDAGLGFIAYFPFFILALAGIVIGPVIGIMSGITLLKRIKIIPIYELVEDFRPYA